MEVAVKSVVGLGVAIQDSFEGWIFALFFVVIALDAYLGIRDKRVLFFNVLQILGLVVGYYWATSVFEKQDVAGPWAWGRVVGIWFISAALFHTWYAVKFLKRRAQIP